MIETKSERMSEPIRILVVDDQASNVQMVGLILGTLGHEIIPASDGPTALKRVAAHVPDLILLDVMMPRISGFEVCKRLRADRATRDIAILMITALDQPSDMDRAVEAGTDDFLSKPINKTELLLRVRALLRARIYQRDLERALAYIEAVERGDG